MIRLLYKKSRLKVDEPYSNWYVLMKIQQVEISCNRAELEKHKQQEIIKSQQQSSTATDIDSEFLTPMAAYLAYLIIKKR